MKMSTRSRYGLRLMVELALNHKAGALQLSEIARRQDISEKYLGQIVISLRNSKLIQSVRGAQGGYYLSKDPSDITVYDVVESLEGTIVPVVCTKEGCDRLETCVTARVWSILDKAVHGALSGIRLSDLVDWYNQGVKNVSFDI